MKQVFRRRRDYSGERACPDESVFTDSVCRMRMRDIVREPIFVRCLDFIFVAPRVRKN